MNERLRKVRDRAGLTLQQVADAAGVTLRNYQRIEAGTQLPRVDVALKIAAALGVAVEMVFSGTQPSDVSKPKGKSRE